MLSSVLKFFLKFGESEPEYTECSYSRSGMCPRFPPRISSGARNFPTGGLALPTSVFSTKGSKSWFSDYYEGQKSLLPSDGGLQPPSPPLEPGT